MNILSIVITGASGGIGAAMARRLGRDGHRLVLSGRRERELGDVAMSVGSNAEYVIGDMTKRSHVIRLRDEAIRMHGTVDVWINNAGRGITRSTLDLTDADFDEMMAVNVKSALYGMQAIVPHFVEKGSGHVINISSFLARVPLATHRSAYSAAKAALNSLTANVRAEVASHPDIHVSLVMPGLVSTDFARNVIGEPAAAAPPWIPGGKALPEGAMTPQTADEVAEVIAQVIAKPAPEIYTNPKSAEVARWYLDEIAAQQSS